MALALYMSTLMIAVFSGVLIFKLNWSNELHVDSGDYNGSTVKSRISQKGDTGWDENGYKDQNVTFEISERENLETALIRTCRAVSTLSHSNNCGDWTLSSKMWAFVGTANTKGSIDSTAYSGSTSPTFSCASPGRENYAKYLLQQSIPASFVVGKGYKYNLLNLNDTNADPCGYADIIGK